MIIESSESSIRTPVYSEGEMEIRGNFDDIFENDPHMNRFTKQLEARPQSSEYLVDIINDV